MVLGPEQKIDKHKGIRQELYSGPIPHPDLLKKYDSVIPGLAERIVAMAEEEQKHRHKLDDEDSTRQNKMIDTAVTESKGAMGALKLGQLCGLGVSVLCIIVAFVCALKGLDNTVVVAFTVVPVASLIRAFIPSKSDTYSAPTDTAKDQNPNH